MKVAFFAINKMQSLIRERINFHFDKQFNVCQVVFFFSFQALKGQKNKGEVGFKNRVLHIIWKQFKRF